MRKFKLAVLFVVIALIAIVVFSARQQNIASIQAAARYSCSLTYTTYSDQWTNCVADRTR